MTCTFNPHFIVPDKRRLRGWNIRCAIDATDKLDRPKAYEVAGTVNLVDVKAQRYVANLRMTSLNLFERLEDAIYTEKPSTKQDSSVKKEKECLDRRGRRAA